LQASRELAEADEEAQLAWALAESARPAEADEEAEEAEDGDQIWSDMQQSMRCHLLSRSGLFGPLDQGIVEHVLAHAEVVELRSGEGRR